MRCIRVSAESSSSTTHHRCFRSHIVPIAFVTHSDQDNPTCQEPFSSWRWCRKYYSPIVDRSSRPNYRATRAPRSTCFKRYTLAKGDLDNLYLMPRFFASCHPECRAPKLYIARPNMGTCTAPITRTGWKKISPPPQNQGRVVRGAGSTSLHSILAILCAAIGFSNHSLLTIHALYSSSNTQLMSQASVCGEGGLQVVPMPVDNDEPLTAIKIYKIRRVARAVYACVCVSVCCQS